MRARLAVLRAFVNGHRVAPGGASAELEACAAALKAARYGVVVWSPAMLDPLETEMLLGLIEACNATTRCAGLPLALAGNADGVAQACTWSAGFPTRFGFAGDAVLHDPWRFDAARLVSSGEADAVLWIADHAPPWPPGPPSIVLAGSALDFTPHVQIAVGTPGRDHAALLHAPELGALAHRGGEPGIRCRNHGGDPARHCRPGRTMLTRLAGGRVVDPANSRDAIGDLWFEDGRIVAPPQGRTPDATRQLDGAIVLAGGIDIHSHIAGANVNTARLLLPELRRSAGTDIPDDRAALCGDGLHLCRRAGDLARGRRRRRMPSCARFRISTPPSSPCSAMSPICFG